MRVGGTKNAPAAIKYCRHSCGVPRSPQSIACSHIFELLLFYYSPWKIVNTAHTHRQRRTKPNHLYERRETQRPRFLRRLTPAHTYTYKREPLFLRDELHPKLVSCVRIKLPDLNLQYSATYAMMICCVVSADSALCALHYHTLYRAASAANGQRHAERKCHDAWHPAASWRTGGGLTAHAGTRHSALRAQIRLSAISVFCQMSGGATLWRRQCRGHNAHSPPFVAGAQPQQTNFAARVRWAVLVMRCRCRRLASTLRGQLHANVCSCERSEPEIICLIKFRCNYLPTCDN